MTQPYRDENGRFAPGNSFSKGIGRPPKEKEQRLHTTLIAALDNGAWERIVQKAVEQAMEGDAMARKFLASYSLGTPVHRSDSAQQWSPEDWLNAMRDDTPEQEQR